MSFTDGIIHGPHYHDLEPDIAGAEQHFWLGIDMSLLPGCRI
jgi:hypothetical protein